jgi:oligopeptide transport system substrate-binding protein
MRLARVMAVAAAATMVLAACGGDDDTPDDPGGSEDPGAAEGGTVRLPITQSPDEILPMESHAFDNLTALEILYSGLVRFDPETTEPYNYMAEDISSDDNITWTITIKEGWTFHNGEPVDAAAFKRSWDYTAYGPNAMYNNFFFDRILGYGDMQGEYEEDDDGNVTVLEEPAAEELAGVRVVDDYTLEVELSDQFAAFPLLLGYAGFFPVAEECIADVQACGTNPIGNGPFQVEEWNQGVSLTATRYEEYQGDEAPSYDRIEWTEYPGGSSWADFQAGDMDASFPPPEQWEAAQNDADLMSRYVETTGTGLTYLGFPMYHGAPWDNIDFRHAISLAIDMETIIEQVVPGQYVAADSWTVPGGVPGGEAGTCGEWCGFDPDRAKDLLDQAGGWTEGDVMTIHLGADPTQEAIFKAIGDQIQLNLGIPYELDPTEDFFSRRSEHDFDGAFRNNWFPDYPLNENYLAPTYKKGSPDDSNFGWYSEAFEDKLTEGDQAASVDEAAATYLEAERILAEEFPTVPLIYSVNQWFYSENLDNVGLNPFGGAILLRELEVVG